MLALSLAQSCIAFAPKSHSFCCNTSLSLARSTSLFFYALVSRSRAGMQCEQRGAKKATRMSL